MTYFSERNHIIQTKTMQFNDIDSDLRIGIWNVFYKYYFEYYDSNYIDDRQFILIKKFWSDFLKQPIDNFPQTYTLLISPIKSALIDKREYRIKGGIVTEYITEWWWIYDFLEFFALYDYNTNRNGEFQKTCNLLFEHETSGYRFVNGIIAPVTSTEEINEIETAIEKSTKEIQIHLTQSLTLLSNKKNPDFRNSIKEAITAVERQCQLISEDSDTLTKALEKIERGKKVRIHKHLNEAFQKIYSWTNEDGGIRHPLKDDPNVDLEDAQFMLIACSAFINYLRIKKMKANL
jgi:ribosome-associated translation inhibitor RaiA